MKLFPISSFPSRTHTSSSLDTHSLVGFQIHTIHHRNPPPFPVFRLRSMAHQSHCFPVLVLLQMAPERVKPGLFSAPSKMNSACCARCWSSSFTSTISGFFSAPTDLIRWPSSSLGDSDMMTGSMRLQLCLWKWLNLMRSVIRVLVWLSDIDCS